MISKRLRRYSLLLAILAAAEVSLSSPLFATLGFEYATIMAVALSMICGLYVAGDSAPWRGHLGRVLMLAVIPLAVSIVSLPFIPNCAFLDGLVFYTEIAIPSALLGAGFGLAFAWMTKSRRLALWLFLIFWL